jgi:hypothetical protein
MIPPTAVVGDHEDVVLRVFQFHVLLHFLTRNVRVEAIDLVVCLLAALRNPKTICCPRAEGRFQAGAGRISRG